MLKTGIVGCGNIAKIHFAALKGLEDVEIVAAADIDLERGETYSEEYENKRFICIHLLPQCWKKSS